jgi:hypothetical protein
MLLESRTLRNHAESILAKVYSDAREQAAAETELKIDRFPAVCRWNLDSLRTAELPL